MGSSSSRSQANQQSTTANADNRIINESGIVAQNSALTFDYSTDLDYNTSNYTNVSSYDLSNRSTNNSYTDGRVTNTSWADYSDNSNTQNFADYSNRAVSNVYTDGRTTNTNWAFADSSDRSVSNSYADNSTWADYSDRSTFNSYTDGRTTNTSTSNAYTDGRVSNTWDSSQANSNNVTNTTTVDPEIAKAALSFAGLNDARNGQSLDKLLGYAAEMTGKTQDSATSMAARFQDNVLQAFDSARTTSPGGIDNKTMIILGVAGAAALAVIANKKG